MPEVSAIQSPDGDKRSVLVVDDEAINREMLEAFLEDEYEVLTAADGDEAMQLVWEHRNTLSLVLLDLMMPKMPGQEVLRRMKESHEVKHVP